MPSDQARPVNQLNGNRPWPVCRLTHKQALVVHRLGAENRYRAIKRFWPVGLDPVPLRKENALHRIVALQPGEMVEFKSPNGDHARRDLTHWTAFGLGRFDIRVIYGLRHGQPDRVRVIRPKPWPLGVGNPFSKTRAECDSDEEFEAYSY